MATALGRRELGSWKARHELGKYLDEDALIDRIGLAATLEVKYVYISLCVPISYH